MSMKGILWGVVLSIPLWALILWVVFGLIL
jgi:hypothetical protein